MTAVFLISWAYIKEFLILTQWRSVSKLQKSASVIWLGPGLPPTAEYFVSTLRKWQISPVTQLWSLVSLSFHELFNIQWTHCGILDASSYAVFCQSQFVMLFRAPPPGAPCLAWHMPGPLWNPQLLSVKSEKCLDLDASICCAFIYGLCNVPCRKDRAGSGCSGYFSKQGRMERLLAHKHCVFFIYSALKCLPLSKQACRSMPVTSGLVLLCFPGNLMKAMEKEISSSTHLFCCCVFTERPAFPKAKFPR